MICTYIVRHEVLHKVIPKGLMDVPFNAGNRLIMFKGGKEFQSRGSLLK